MIQQPDQFIITIENIITMSIVIRKISRTIKTMKPIRTKLMCIIIIILKVPKLLKQTQQ